MFDKWKNIKIAGTVVILAAVAVFLFTNIRIKSASDYMAEKSTGIMAENVSESAGKNSADSQAGITAEGGETGSRDALETGVEAEGEANKPDTPTKADGTAAGGAHQGEAQYGGTQQQGAQQGGTQNGGQTGTAAGEKNDSANSGQNQPGGSNESETEAKKTIQVSIEIRCDSAVKIKDSVGNPGIKEKIPDSGEILKVTVYSVPEGTNVYELLSMAAAANGIAITANASKTYVMSINNLDQMMLGQQSGWKYSVNNNVPLMAASSYILQNGDRVKWFYVLSASEE